MKKLRLEPRGSLHGALRSPSRSQKVEERKKAIGFYSTGPPIKARLKTLDPGHLLPIRVVVGDHGHTCHVWYLMLTDLWLHETVNRIS